MKRIKFSQEEIDYIIKTYQNGEKTTLDLAKKFNCSRYTIERRLKENDIALKAKYKYEDLTGKQFGKLTVMGENKERYLKDVAKTTKPHRYWWCKCSCGNEQLIQVESSHLKNGHTTSCGCIKSKAEQKIIKILQENNIKFKTEYTFPDLKGINNGILRFDFAILNDNDDLKYLIEYNGKQHYIQNNGWNTPLEFKTRTQNDELKLNYVKEKNIPLIIIPYTVTPENINIKHLCLEKNEYAYLA